MVGPDRNDLEHDLRAWRNREFPERHAARAAWRSAGRRRLLQWTAPALACALLAAAGLQGWRWYEGMPLEQHVLETARGEQRAVDLAEGSRILANTGSRIEVVYSRARREARLVEGEALFSVVRDGRPFVVRAAGGEVRVLGTEFLVRVQGERVEVAVLSGRVQVCAHAEDCEAELLPGERVAYAPAGRVEALPDADPRTIAAWRAGRIALHDATLGELKDELNRYRGQPIELSDSRLAALRVSGVFDLRDPLPGLRALEDVLPVRVSQRPDGGLLIVPDTGFARPVRLGR